MVSLLNAPRMSKKIPNKKITSIAPFEEASDSPINYFQESNMSILDETYTIFNNSDIFKPKNTIINFNWTDVVESSIGQLSKKKSLSLFPILFALTNSSNSISESNMIESNSKSSR